MAETPEPRRVILVLIDGLGYETSVRHCGYAEGLVRLGAARRWRLRTALPSMSRPLYETVLTGLAPHDHGITSNSPEYRTQATRMDALLAALIPDWRAAGYDVLVTADHGMNADGYHGGTLDDVCHVALYHVGHPHGGIVEEEASQLAVAPTVLSLMGLPIPETMRLAPLR
jgi:predicted AlkP superfamily pyrophosphatase or phosphodiesterase